MKPIRDDAVSNVVGAFLLFGLLITTLTVIQVEFVPRWDEDREARHMQTVLDQFRNIRSDLDRQVDNRSALVLHAPIKLGTPTGFSFFRSEDIAGEAGFDPTGATDGLRVTSTQLRVQVQNGAASGAQEGTWVGQGASVADQPPTDVLSLQDLRIRLTAPNSESDLDCFRFSLTDADGNPAGRLTFVKRNFPAVAPTTHQVLVRTENGANAVLYEQGESWGASVVPTTYRIDALDPRYLFTDLLATAKAPYDISASWGAACGGGTLAAEYLSVYERQGNGGRSYQAGDSGLVVAPYTPSIRPAGALLFHKSNQRFPEQTYRLEHGGVLLEQPDGVGMVEPPRFEVAVPATGLASLEWWLPGLDGGADAVAGSETATVILEPTTARLDVRGQVPCVRITIPTIHPAAWSSFWKGRMLEGGFTVYTETSAASPPAGNCPASTANCPGDVSAPFTDTCQFVITTTDDSATLVFFGPTPAPASTVYDISLSLRQATIHVDLRASG